MRLVRNVYDNLVARFHLLCNEKREPYCGSGVASREIFLSYLHKTNLSDVCTYLWWHHRANRLALHYPLTTLEYESLYTMRSRYVRTVLDFLLFEKNRRSIVAMPQGDPTDPERCNPSLLKERKMELRGGHVLPGYLSMYDEAMVRRVSTTENKLQLLYHTEPFRIQLC